MAGTHNAPQSPNEAILQNILGEQNDIRVPQSRIEELLIELLEQLGGLIAEQISYTTTAPTADNTDGGLKVVVLSAAPATKYNGYIYIITGA